VGARVNVEVVAQSWPKHVVILGAGPAGLAVGHELTSQGIGVTILERNDYVGGLCRTVSEQGYKFDLGGHRWFTKNEDLNHWFRNLMEGELVLVNRISRIYHDGTFFLYPITLGDIFQKLNPLAIMQIGASFLFQAMRQAVHPKPIISMKDAYISQFGAKLYEMFFRHYTEKVWGRPCEELSADWVSQRSSGLSIMSVIADVLFKPKEKAESLIETFMYPRDGYMRIPERMAENIVSRGGTVKLNASVTRIAYRGPNDFEVWFGEGENTSSVLADRVVSTIPLGIFARILEPACDTRVKDAATSLEFRDLITVNLRLKRKQVTEDTWLYVQDPDIIFGRIHEPKNWSKAMVPDDEHTSLVLECFCSLGDAIWQLEDAEIVRCCIDDLVDKLKFFDREEVEGWTAVRTIQAYPVYDFGYKPKITTIMDYLTRLHGAHVVGRGGTFRYNNADHSIEMGLMLGRRLLGADIDPLAVNTEPEYQEIKQHVVPRRDHYQLAGGKPGHG
jgi:protoporphyrinogen oxidase